MSNDKIKQTSVWVYRGLVFSSFENACANRFNTTAQKLIGDERWRCELDNRIQLRIIDAEVDAAIQLQYEQDVKEFMATLSKYPTFADGDFKHRDLKVGCWVKWYDLYGHKHFNKIIGFDNSKSRKYHNTDVYLNSVNYRVPRRYLDLQLITAKRSNK